MNISQIARSNADEFVKVCISACARGRAHNDMRSFQQRAFRTTRDYISTQLHNAI